MYDLPGKELYYQQTGKMNKADIRYGFALPAGNIDLVAVSNRTDHTIELYNYLSDGALEISHQNQLISRLNEAIYGLCMFHSLRSGKFFVFANGKDGRIEQWELYAEKNKDRPSKKCPITF